MKKFNRQVFTFILLSLIMICSAFLINTTLLNKTNYFKLTKNINTIVLGHSHPECAYNDSLITDFKNLAQSGEAYFYTYIKIKKIISKNNQIKTIFIEFEPGQIDTIMDSWTWGDEHISDGFAKYFPLLDYPEFKLLWHKNSSAILAYFPKTFIKKMWHNMLSILKNKNIESDNQFGGYNFITRAKIDSLLKNMENQPEIQSGNINPIISNTNIEYLSKIINYCNQKGLQVLLIRSPLYKTYGDATSEKEFKNILNTFFYQTEFLDFRDFPLHNDQYGDFGHLNYKGAKSYSIFFNQLLRMNLLKRENKQVFIDSEIEKVAVSQNIQNK
ncbi:MAG: hypothetical protein ABIW47_05900 [Ginsengibacter sp.]